MYLRRLNIAASFVLIGLVFTACGGGGGSTGPTVSPRNVRFEVTGTMSGAFVLTHTGTTGTVTTADIAALPLNLDITYNASVSVIAVSIAEVNATQNNSGKTVRVRVLSGGREVRTQTVTANAIGNVLFQPMTYAFP
jgi:hypothetical protein